MDAVIMSPMPKKGRARQLEATVKDDVKKVLDAHDWFWWMPPSNKFGRSGISDFHAVKPGLFMAIETKRGLSTKKANEPTTNQIGFLQSIKSARHFAFVVYEDRVEHLDAFLGALDRATLAHSKGEQIADEDGAMMMNCIAEMTQEL